MPEIMILRKKYTKMNYIDTVEHKTTQNYLIKKFWFNKFNCCKNFLVFILASQILILSKLKR